MLKKNKVKKPTSMGRLSIAICVFWSVLFFFETAWAERTDIVLLQYFINYNFTGGWYFTSSPAITANWESDSDNRWTVPFGGGFGKVFRIGQLPVNTSLAAFYNVEKPDNLGPDWSLPLQVQFLFPKG